MKNPHKYADVIKAWADGKDIEVKYLSDEIPKFMDYVLLGIPDFFDSNCVWRIKPETLRYRVALMKENGFYITASEEGGVVTEKHSCFVNLADSFSTVMAGENLTPVP